MAGMELFYELIKHMDEKPDQPIKEKIENEKPELLTARSLEILSGMTTYQLEAIYKHGKRKVRIDDDPACYEALSSMTTYQLAAIFGK